MRLRWSAAIRWAWSSGLAALACTVMTIPSMADTIAVGGTGAALGGMRMIAQAYMAERPETRVIVHPSLGSGGGIRALAEGAIDVAVSARPLKDKEQAVGIRQREYARTPLVVAVGTATHASDISRDDLAAIYRGDRTAWSDGTPIRVVLRPAEDTDTKLLKRSAASLDEALTTAINRPGMVIAATDQDSADKIEILPGAVGTSTLAQIITENRRLRPLALEGVDPTPENLAAGRYPLFKTLFLMTYDNPPAEVQGFVAFVLSPTGKDLLRKTGHLASVAH